MGRRDELWGLTGAELVEGYRAKRFSPVEVTRATLDRIDRLDGQVNAFVTVTHELALRQAAEAERAYLDGMAGLLAGIPMSMKDLTPVKGVRMARGSLLHANDVAEFDAPYVERVQDAGGVILGKTTTPEYGWKGDSGNRVNGPTHNPWKHGRTAGGSSGGGAAAVAAGFGPMAQGSDGAGSIRIPCGFCGVYGLKQSYGLVPQYPPSAIGDLSHMGPMTWSVLDTAMMLQAVAGADPRDRLSYTSNVNYISAATTNIRDLRGVRIAWSPDLGYVTVDPEVARATAAAVERFRELGATVEEVNPGIPDPWPFLDILWAGAMAGLHPDNYDEIRSEIDPGRAKIIDRARTMTAADLAAAHLARAKYFHLWREYFTGYDLLLTPTLPVTAFAAGDDFPAEIMGKPQSYLGWTAFTYPFNATGQPAATVPVGFDQNGLPIGLQVVGRWRDDALVLRASAAFERVAPWVDRRPDLLG